MASGLSIHKAAQLANIAAGIAVSRLGAVAVHVDELAVKLHERIGNNDPASGMALESILPHIRFARRTGKKIVFTNGCFDIIHAGHVTYLAEASELGDFLIVGLNTDASVSRLKGAGRPIHDYAQRATVLGALESVDWVVPFGDEGDDTPLELIKAVKPDVLVKGGDYAPENIVGAREVIANGGTVKVIDLVPGVSTSNIVDKL
jgi:D-beta-D-heptose 7-phosphate kinase/D-beta-D-heptose 1-phosphate adenosyltransferase